MDEEQWTSRTYTEEQRDLNGRCSVVLHVEDDFISNPRLLEDEIEKRGLQAHYVAALGDQIEHARAHLEGYSGPLYPMMSAWLFIRATPEQKARAFLEAARLRGAVGDG